MFWDSLILARGEVQKNNVWVYFDETQILAQII